MLIILPGALHAQVWELGFSGGGSNYQGDLGPDIALNETHFASGLFIKKNLNEFFSLSLSLNQGVISGRDINYSHLATRNLNFSSSITELAYIVEFNFFPFTLGLNPSDFTPYTFIGVAGFTFDPRTDYNGETLRLSTFDTEGKKLMGEKKIPYKKIQIGIPIGGGLKFKISKSSTIAVQLGFRYTYTDYLDDVSTVYYDAELLQNSYGAIASEISDRSVDKIGFLGKQRGRSDQNDWYIIGGISLSYSIKKSICFEF